MGYDVDWDYWHQALNDYEAQEMEGVMDAMVEHGITVATDKCFAWAGDTECHGTWARIAQIMSVPTTTVQSI